MDKREKIVKGEFEWEEGWNLSTWKHLEERSLKEDGNVEEDWSCTCVKVKVKIRCCTRK